MLGEWVKSNTWKGNGENVLRISHIFKYLETKYLKDNMNKTLSLEWRNLKEENKK